MKSVILLSICLCISSVDCLVNCTEVVVDGQYTNLSVYNEPTIDSSATKRLINWMFNRRGRKWSFDISFDDNKDGIVHNFGDPVEYNYSDRRVLYYRSEHDFRWDGFGAINIHCPIHPKDTFMSCYMISSSERNRRPSKTVEEPIKFNYNSVFLRPIPSMFSQRLHHSITEWYLLAISKDNRNERTKITFTREQTIRQEKCNQTNSVQCPVIPFIDGPTPTNTMSDQLFKQIESVVEYKNGSIYGHLLFFTINNRPFYCLQPESQPLSQQV